jgi:hypothetical protein
MAGLSRQSPQNAKTADWMVADAVRAKPVSEDKFPAIREINREFSIFAPSAAEFDAGSGCVAGALRVIPYSN